MVSIADIIKNVQYATYLYIIVMYFYNVSTHCSVFRFSRTFIIRLHFCVMLGRAHSKGHGDMPRLLLAHVWESTTTCIPSAQLSMRLAGMASRSFIT